MNDEITEGNILMAKFVGNFRDICENPFNGCGIIRFNESLFGNTIHTISLLKFDTSWDWLITVIKKINLISNVEENKYFKELSESISKLNIEHTWKIVLELLNWYNNKNE